MSNINDRNFLGAYVSVVGNATGAVEYRTLGERQVAEITVAVNNGYKDKQTGEFIQTGTNFYTLQATPDHARSNWPDVQKGDKVRIDDAQLEAKGYTRNNGEPAVSLDLKWGTVEILESRAARNSGGGSGGNAF